jgi:hypothetical protein
VAVVEQAVAEMRPDKPRAARDQHLHGAWILAE